jgi:hypothetical protein
LIERPVKIKTGFLKKQIFFKQIFSLAEFGNRFLNYQPEFVTMLGDFSLRSKSPSVSTFFYKRIILKKMCIKGNQGE